MLIDRHTFEYTASVPWPNASPLYWDGIDIIENWLEIAVGKRFCTWAYSDSGNNYYIGVAFKWDKHRSLFVLTWS